MSNKIELSIPLDSGNFTFAAADDDGGRTTFAGLILPGGESEVWGGILSLRPAMFAEDDGRTVTALWQHNKDAVLGSAALSVGRRGVMVEGRVAQNGEGRMLEERIAAQLGDGVKLEMSMGVSFDSETFRKTKGREKGEYTYDRASIVEASVVMRGEVKGTRFRMSEGVELDGMPPEIAELAARENEGLDKDEDAPHSGVIHPALARALGL